MNSIQQNSISSQLVQDARKWVLGFESEFNIKTLVGVDRSVELCHSMQCKIQNLITDIGKLVTEGQKQEGKLTEYLIEHERHHSELSQDVRHKKEELNQISPRYLISPLLTKHHLQNEVKQLAENYFTSAGINYELKQVYGEALKGFWERAVAVPDAPARPLIAFDWYRGFLQAMIDAQAYTWFSKLVYIGEIVIGVALILGLFTGIAAFLGGFMNWNFMMAGSASTNPVLFTLSILLILAWKTAGWWGLDRFVLTALGTPWQPGKAFQGKTPENP